MAKSGFENLFGFFKKSGPDQDLKEFLALSAKSPDDMRLKIKIGELYFKKKDIPKGIAVLRDVAEHYTKEGFFLKAIAIYKNIIKFSPGSVEFNEKLAGLYHQMGMKPDSIQQYQIVINYFQTHHQPADALRACQKLVQVDPEGTQPRLRLAETYFNQGMEEESLKEYERIAKHLRKEMKQLDVLAEVYEKILLKRPKELGLLRELCVFYLKLKNPQKTLRKIEKYKLEKDEQFKPIYDKALEMKAFLDKAQADAKEVAKEAAKEKAREAKEAKKE